MNAILNCQEEIAKLPSLNFLYGKRHLRRLMLKRLESYDDTSSIATEIIEKEKQMIEDVEKEISDVKAKIEEITFKCDAAIQNMRVTMRESMRGQK
jgi:hypothetical protein